MTKEHKIIRAKVGLLELAAMTLNTLKLARRLAAAGMPSEQADRVAEAIAEDVAEQVATKTDIAEVRAEIAALRAEVKTEVAALRAELKPISPSSGPKWPNCGPASFNGSPARSCSTGSASPDWWSR